MAQQPFRVSDEVIMAIMEADGAREQRTSERRRRRETLPDPTLVLCPDAQRVRTEKRDELTGLAVAILQWRDDFAMSKASVGIHRHVSERDRLTLFEAGFTTGGAGTETARTAALFVEGRARWTLHAPDLWYSERHDGKELFSTWVSDPQDMVERVHPRFLEEAAAFLKGPDPWRFILRDFREATRHEE